MCHNQPHSNSSNYRNGASVTYYQEREPNPQLKGKCSLILYILIEIDTFLTGTFLVIIDFEPFNLEAWWGQRVVQSISRNTSS